YTEKGEYEGKYSKRFDSLEEIEAFQTANQLSQGMVGTIKDVNKEQKNTYAPKLFSLSDLQSEANRKFNMGANDTLKVVQSVYEKKGSVAKFPISSFRGKIIEKDSLEE